MAKCIKRASVNLGTITNPNAKWRTKKAARNHQNFGDLQKRLE